MYRLGTTVIVIGGPSVGVIGKVTGYTTSHVYIEQAFGPSRGLVVADTSDVMRTPHPLSFYQRVQGRHGPCAGCDAVDSAKATH
jgi:hypothetical protein